VSRVLDAAGLVATLALVACYESHEVAASPDGSAGARCDDAVVEPTLAESGNTGAVAVDGCERIAAVGGPGVVVRSEDGGRTFRTLELDVAPSQFPALVFDEGGTLHLVFDAMGELLHLMAAPGSAFGAPRPLLPSAGGRIAVVEPRAHHAMAAFGRGALVGLATFPPDANAAWLAIVASDGDDIEARQVSDAGERPGAVRVCAAGGVLHAVYTDATARRVRHASGDALGSVVTRTVAAIVDEVGTGWSHADVACFADGGAIVVHVDGSEILGSAVSPGGELGAPVVLAAGVLQPFYPHVEARTGDALVTWSASFGGEMGYVLVGRDARALAPASIAPDPSEDGEPEARPVHCATETGYVLVAQSHAEDDSGVPPVHGATFLSDAAEPLEWREVVGHATNVSRVALDCTPDGAWVLAAAEGEPLVLRRVASARP
jgi:hypothetical protein